MVSTHPTSSVREDKPRTRLHESADSGGSARPEFSLPRPPDKTGGLDYWAADLDRWQREMHELCKNPAWVN